ncbi:MAG TPA: zinc ribbon domain-containing protein [Gemmatimonadaceae bacterium]|nr:zinc ribbon domain-containing protein [Gemmatimonadaceae bacterium]
MPTYEFRCPKGHEFEKFYRSMSAAQLQVPCPACGLPAERQVSAGAGLVFKGSGFYITDYGRDGKKAAGAASSDSASGSSDSGSSKNDSASPSGALEKSTSSEKGSVKPAAETKSGGDPKPTTASKSAAKKSSGKAKSSE